MTFHPGTPSAVAGSTVSCVMGFNIHTILGDVGEVVGILSGAASLAWVAYQFIQSRRKTP